MENSTQSAAKPAWRQVLAFRNRGLNFWPMGIHRPPKDISRLNSGKFLASFRHFSKRSLNDRVLIRSPDHFAVSPRMRPPLGGRPRKPSFHFTTRLN